MDKLPDFLRNQIIEQVSAPVVEAAPSRGSIPTPVSEGKPVVNSVFEHRKHLKDIKQYAKEIKVDDDDWTEDDWAKFGEWLAKRNKKVKDMSMDEVIGNVFKTKNELSESTESQKSRLRQQVLKTTLGDKFDKVMSKF